MSVISTIDLKRANRVLMTENNKKSLVRPSVDTNFHIDFEWWASRDPSWKLSLSGLLSADEKTKYAHIIDEDKMVDWVDPVTGKVVQVDGLRNIILSEVATQEDFLNPRIAITEGIFRLFLRNGNVPLTPNQMAEVLNKDAKLILRTLQGVRPPKGIRPKT